MAQKLPANVASYLKKHLIKDYPVEWNKKAGIDNIIVIPTIAEYENIKSLIGLFLKNDPLYFPSTLLLFVINNSQYSDRSVKDNNQKSLDFLRSIISSEFNAAQKTKTKKSGLQIGLIDAASDNRELEEKHFGVGLARKIGMDTALTIFDYDIDTKKLIICLDADCNILPNYLTIVVHDFNFNNYDAAFVNFEHNIEGGGEEQAAIVCYEIFLRYYVVGLKYAKSDYAFHTIGSTMLCDHNAYIKIGGMNKRKAAEDFYFLEKLAKNFRIDKISSTTVCPSSRCSWRVPFGTGQRVTRFLSKTHNEYLLFNSEVFEILKAWLEVYMSDSSIVPLHILNSTNEIHPELCNFLTQQNFEEQWEKILANTKSDKQLRHQKKIWFDGFKTLKLIHHLRDTAYPDLNMFDALDLFFTKLKINKSIKRDGNEIPDLKIQKKYLYLLREIDNNNAH